MHSGEPYWTTSRHDIARREGTILYDIMGHAPDWKARGERGVFMFWMDFLARVCRVCWGPKCSQVLSASMDHVRVPA